MFNKLIKKVTFDIDNLKDNTAIAAMMSVMNDIFDSKKITRKELEIFTILLNPFAPHVTEEVWEKMNFGGTVTDQKWPEYDESKCVEDEVVIPVQVNGKVRAKLTAEKGISEQDALALALENDSVKQFIDGKTVVKKIYVPGRIINIVVK